MTIDKGISSDDKTWELDEQKPPTFKIVATVILFLFAFIGFTAIITTCG